MVSLLFLGRENSLYSTHLLAFLSQEGQLHVDVVKIPSQGSSGALYDDCPALQGNADWKSKVDASKAAAGSAPQDVYPHPKHPRRPTLFGDVNRLVAKNGLHPKEKQQKEAAEPQSKALFLHPLRASH